MDRASVNRAKATDNDHALTIIRPMGTFFPKKA